MARPKKVIDLCTGVHTKAEINARRAGERQFKVSREALSPPDWLNPIAKEEFARVVREAGTVDFLDNLDLSILAIYANAWSRYVQVTRYIEQADGSDAGEIGYRLDAKGNTYKVLSPYVSAMNAYIKQIMQCSTKLGMATTDRLKLIVPVKEDKEENPFLKFIK